ncbi:TPA: hypothetical protein ACSP84_000835 [Aeromonas veronii]|uniref:hypothetical protein n=1 Tax=Aeromonas veronii TaxID=654 RepID=UPI0038DAA57F
MKKTKLPFKPTEVTLDRSSAAEYLSEFEKYRIVQDRLFESGFDRLLKQTEVGNNQDNDDA